MSSDPDAARASIPADRSEFASTRWSVVAAAGQHSSPDARQALESLCGTYWYPLYAYVRRRVGDPDEARDLTQAFFAELLEKNFVATAAPDRGRFRAYLLTALKHFLCKQWAMARAKKRGGGRQLLSLDFASGDSRYGIEPMTNLSAEQLYERQWALTLLERVMERLRAEFERAGKAEQFIQLKQFLIGDHTGTTYSAAAAGLNLSQAAAKMAVQRMRRRYRSLLREEIAETVDGAEQVEQEIRSLFSTLASD